MDKIDVLGRRRRLSQNRGLRSLFPKLPNEYESRVIRLAMPLGAWERFERFVSRSPAPTLPRAYGEVIEQLLANFDSSSRDIVRPSLEPPQHPRGEPIDRIPADWQTWQMQKELALLAASAPERSQRTVSPGLQ